MAKCSTTNPCRWTGLTADTWIESDQGRDCSIVISRGSNAGHYVSITNARPRKLYARIVGTRDLNNVEFASSLRVRWTRDVIVRANGGDTNTPGYGHPNCEVRSCATCFTSDVIHAIIHSTHNLQEFAKAYHLAGRGNPVIDMDVPVPSVVP